MTTTTLSQAVANTVAMRRVEVFVTYALDKTTDQPITEPELWAALSAAVSDPFALALFAQGYKANIVNWDMDTNNTPQDTLIICFHTLTPECPACSSCKEEVPE